MLHHGCFCYPTNHDDLPVSPAFCVAFTYTWTEWDCFIEIEDVQSLNTGCMPVCFCAQFQVNNVGNEICLLIL